MNTWLEEFHAKTDLNKYPISLRTKGGIGYRLPSGETVSNFVGHPVHYFDNGLWKPITLEPHSNGDFEGSDFSWRRKQVFYKGRTLFEPRAVLLDGVEHKLFLRQDGNRIVADLPFGQYEIIFSERGVKELLTIRQPIEGLLEFDVPHANKPQGLFKKERHIVHGIAGESFQLTKDMTYPLVIDPDYSADTSDGFVYGQSTSYSTARNTSVGFNNSVGVLEVANTYPGDGNYYVYRSFLKFLTSGIPDTDTVTQVNLAMVMTSDFSTTDFDVQIVKQDWSASDPISAGNRETIYDACLSGTADSSIWRNTSGASVNTQYVSGNLSTAWVVLTGNTYYSLRSSRDFNNNTPTTFEDIQLGSAENTTSGYRPVLVVTHAAGGNGSFHYLA